MFSLGVHMLSFHKNRRFELGSLFSPPVVAVIVSLIFIYFKGQRVMPQAVMKPLVMVGDSMLPLAMFVVGANLAQIRLKHVDRKAVLFLALAKLIMLPCLGLIFLMKVRVPELVGLLIMIELAVPSATLLSVITRHYNKEDILVSQGIFFSHIVSLITIPLFLSLYFTLVVVR
jgi:predicted permease